MRRSKDLYDVELQKQKDEAELEKQTNEWWIHHEEKQNTQRIRLHISSGRAWTIISDMKIECSGYHEQTDTDVYTLTVEQMRDFLSIFYSVAMNTEIIGVRKRRSRTDKGKKREKGYSITESEREKRTERMQKINKNKWR
jgi:hypothetical protein